MSAILDVRMSAKLREITKDNGNFFVALTTQIPSKVKTATSLLLVALSFNNSAVKKKMKSIGIRIPV